LIETAAKRVPVAEVEASIPASTASPAPRNIAVDAYRGFVMFLMMAEVVHLAEVSRAYPGNWFWSILAYNQTHVPWTGCSLHDLIQPSFSFLVGVALPYSIASRLRKGGRFGPMLAHAVWRSLLLIALGIFLRSIDHPITYFTFEDTLTQIGLGYTFLFLLGFRSARWQWGAFAVILAGYWLAWALYPVPGAGFDYSDDGDGDGLLDVFEGQGGGGVAGYDEEVGALFVEKLCAGDGVAGDGFAGFGAVGQARSVAEVDVVGAWDEG